MNKTQYVLGFGIQFDRDGKALDAFETAATIQYIIDRASREFGGCFLTGGRGGWIDPNGSLVLEDGAQLHIVTDRDRGSVVDLAQAIKTHLNQASVILIEQPVRAEFL